VRLDADLVVVSSGVVEIGLGAALALLALWSTEAWRRRRELVDR